MHLSLFLTLLFLGLGAASAEGTVSVKGRNGPITIKLLPRSQWDPERRYRPARIIVTRAVRVCTQTDGAGGCTQERDAWSTAVSRDTPILGNLEKEKAKFHMHVPHPFELYRTHDNITYEEICVRKDGPTLETEDYDLVERTRHIASITPGKLVMRWGAGRIWPVPMAHWNPGEHALHTGSGLTSTWLQLTPEEAEDRPLYMPEGVV